MHNIRSWLIQLLLLATPVASFADNVASTPNSNGTSANASGRNQSDECKPLKTGDAPRIVNDSDAESPTGIARRYRVSATSNPKVFNLDLNIHLSPASPKLLDEAQKCFRQYESKLVDSNGVGLRVNLVNDPAVPSVTVGVAEDKGQGPTAATWTTKMTCPQYIHESLHYAGLVDTYDNDVDTSGKAKYDCRAIEKTTKSIMYNGGQALEEKTDVMLCECASDKCFDDESHAEPASASGTCPAGYKASFSNFRTMNESGLKNWKKQITEMPGQVLITRAAPSTATALTKALTMTLTKPFCNRGSTYFQCAKYSLQSSAQPGGCPEMPQTCKDGSWMQ